MGARRPSTVPGPQPAPRAKARGHRAFDVPTERRRGPRRLATTTARRRLPRPPDSDLDAPRPSPEPRPRTLGGRALVAAREPEGTLGRKHVGKGPPRRPILTHGGRRGRLREGWRAQAQQQLEGSRRGPKPGDASGRYLRKPGARQPSPDASRSQAVARHSLHSGTTGSETSRQPGARPARANQRTKPPPGGGARSRLRAPRPLLPLPLQRAGCVRRPCCQLTYLALRTLPAGSWQNATTLPDPFWPTNLAPFPWTLIKARLVFEPFSFPLVSWRGPAGLGLQIFPNSLLPHSTKQDALHTHTSRYLIKRDVNSRMTKNQK